MIEHPEPQHEPGAAQPTISGPQDRGDRPAPGPGSTPEVMRTSAHPRGLCGDRDCEPCRAIRRKAVAARSQKAAPPPWPLPGPIASLDDVLVVLDWAARSCDPPRANAITRLCQTWLKAHDFATRIRALEARLAHLSTERK